MKKYELSCITRSKIHIKNFFLYVSVFLMILMWFQISHEIYLIHNLLI